MCDCGYCSSPPVEWEAEERRVLLPLAIRYVGGGGNSAWASLVKFAGEDSMIVYSLRLKGEPYLHVGTLRSATDVFKRVYGGAKGDWSFLTDQGDLPVSLLSSDRVVTSSRALLRPPSSLCYAMRRSVPARKKMRVASSSTLPPPSPNEAPPPCRTTPYLVDSILKTQEARDLVKDLPAKWDADTIVTLILHGIKVPLLQIPDVVVGRNGHVHCVFSLPDGSLSEKVYLHINHLCLLYKDQIRHLL